ncbi:hypothetical protein [Cohnella yongneupensis]|uniref:Uncharacterized protein n=1 Tax=Cohnella yongneupensis TaxID=425006 RepID=A0ABW0QTN0_9BACL
MNKFRTKGFHNITRRFFSWVFYSGKVQSYFLTRELEGYLPPAEEITTQVKTYGRHFDGAKMVKKADFKEEKLR